MYSISNPKALGIWLLAECRRNNVEVRLNTRADSACLSSDRELRSLEIYNTVTQTTSTLRCNKLVVAAGPWTPSTYKALFPSSPVRFDPTISAGDWYVFKSPTSADDHSVAAVYLDNLVGQKLEFAGRNDHTIWATGKERQTGTLPKAGQVPSPDQEALQSLKAYARTYLRPGYQTIDKGRSYRPANRNQLPVIAGVPAARLYKKERAKCCGKVSVFINSGHGSYGVTLSMGSGKVMSQMILGDKVALDISRLGLL